MTNLTSAEKGKGRKNPAPVARTPLPGVDVDSILESKIIVGTYPPDTWIHQFNHLDYISKHNTKHNNRVQAIGCAFYGGSLVLFIPLTNTLLFPIPALRPEVADSDYV